ncbi:MAG: CoB--CoM heterodisulfide reductase iron-sulfur subunit B family protein [Candidatus Bathyarchaeia archaeon]
MEIRYIVERLLQYTYYPGCSVQLLQKGYDTSTRLVAEALGIGLVELEDWNCCGATAYISIDQLSAHALVARNLARAERTSRDILVICPSCFTTLNKTNTLLAEDTKLRKQVEFTLGRIGLTYFGSLKIRHLLDILINDVGEERIRSFVSSDNEEFGSRGLGGLKVAPYYGCQITRPMRSFDDPEAPTTMDRVLSWAGAEVVNYPLKARCCGGTLLMTNEDVGLPLVRNLLKCAVENGAQCIATACPLCQMNLESYQGKINKKFGTHYSIPSVYFTQLLGLALGLSMKNLGIGKELVSAKKLLASLRRM